MDYESQEPEIKCRLIEYKSSLTIRIEIYM